MIQRIRGDNTATADNERWRKLFTGQRGGRNQHHLFV